MIKKISKGFKMEEQLKNYFIELGYYVVRGVPFVYKSFDVTDIDIWLYSRESSLTRNITIVDVKNKKTPQAMERIFWAKGLAEAVKANNVIIATTDRRKEVKNFGSDLGVLVLDGDFISKLSKHERFLEKRFSDEEFLEEIEKYKLCKIDGDWKKKILKSKSLLANNINFDSCNQWLETSKFFMDQILTKPRQRDVALRCFYYLLSLFFIGVDFVLKELSFLEHDIRVNHLVEGFKYGEKGREGVDKMLSFSLLLVEEYASEANGISTQIRTKVMDDFNLLPSNILGEYFAKADVGKIIFPIAKELENLAMSRLFKNYSESSVDMRSAIGCLLDYWDINRKKFSEAINAL